MNKKELIESIAGAADISKAAAEKALNATLTAVADALKKGDKVTLVGFGHSLLQNGKHVPDVILRLVNLSRSQLRRLPNSRPAANCPTL